MNNDLAQLLAAGGPLAGAGLVVVLVIREVRGILQDQSTTLRQSLDALRSEIVALRATLHRKDIP